jgi:hypothetical protein
MDLSGNYRAAIDEAVRKPMLRQPSFSANPRAILNTWLQADMVEHLIRDSRKREYR